MLLVTIYQNRDIFSLLFKYARSGILVLFLLQAFKSCYFKQKKAALKHNIKAKLLAK